MSKVFLDDQDPGLFKYFTGLKTKERERENMSLIFSSLFLGDGEPLGVSQLEILVDSPAVK